MARIAGVDLPRDKKILYALPYIYGIGPRNAKKILAETGVNADARVRDLRDAEVARLRQVIERDYKVEGALRTEVAMNIDRKSTRLNSSHSQISDAVVCVTR